MPSPDNTAQRSRINTASDTPVRDLEIDRSILTVPDRFLARREKIFAELRAAGPIDYSQDAAEWSKLSSAQQDIIVMALGRFSIGEKSGASVLDPLISFFESERRTQDAEIYRLIKADEARHSKAFLRAIREIAGYQGNPEEFKMVHFARFFDQTLPGLFDRITDDPSRTNLALALTAYHLIGEGLAASAGLKGLIMALDGLNREKVEFIGLRMLLGKICLEEAGHLSVGLYQLHRLAHEGGPLDSLRVNTTVKLGSIRFALQTHRGTSEIFSRVEPFPFHFSQFDLTKVVFRHARQWSEAVGSGKLDIDQMLTI